MSSGIGDHLHIRGEYVKIYGKISLELGSPPHTWRIPWVNSFHFFYPRITSTYVENTLCIRHAARSARDHLHIRGEYNKFNHVNRFITGSPPHTWRILNNDGVTDSKVRITSTYVENTIEFCRQQTKVEDHLHIRGEYSYFCKIHAILKGSPPHTWRILTKTWSQILITRITSTYVENTFSTWKLQQCNKDHLHIRGEYS